MSLAQALSTYAALNGMIALSYLCLRLTFALAGKFRREPSARSELRMHYRILSALIAFTVIQPFFPRKSFFQPPAKIWSTSSPGDVSTKGVTAAGSDGFVTFASDREESALQVKTVAHSVLVLALMVLLAGILFMSRDVNLLLRLRRNSHLIRRIGSVSIRVSDDISVPISWWTPGKKVVLVPGRLLGVPTDYRISIAHELQHHRQKDTMWAYPVWTLRIVCALNPFIHLWSRWLSEIQEFACDETLVDRKNVDSRQYARCLVEVAETALSSKPIPACVTGLALRVGRKLLKRRIERMISIKTQRNRLIPWSGGGLLIALMAGTAFASQGLIQDRRVSFADAQKMAENARAQSDFPVTVNASVVKQLNRYIGTPDGRQFMREALQRLESHRILIEAKLTEYHTPAELIAIPIIESGYQNLPAGQSSPSMKAAGLWQLIPSTARKYGLRVDEQKDDRLDVVLATDSAIRYLLSNRLLLKDWQLAALAYNMGEHAVLKGMRETGATDAWALIRAGHEGDQDYLAKLMAAILILRNPQAVE